MSDKIEMKIGDQTLEAPASKINLVYKAPDMHRRIEYPDRFRLDAEKCFEHTEWVKEFHPRTPGLVAKVFDVEPEKVTPDWVREQGSGMKHIASLIDVSLKLMGKGVQTVWVHPEAYLHPRCQLELADVLVELSK